MFKEFNQNRPDDEFAGQISSGANWNIQDGNQYNVQSKISFTSASQKTTLSGKAGETVFDEDFTITLSDAIFIRDMPAGNDISSWFYGSYELPVGLSVTVAKDVKVGVKVCLLKLSGIPTYGSTEKFVPKIPYGYIAGAPALLSYWEALSDNETCMQILPTYSFDIEKLDNEPVYLACSRKRSIVPSLTVQRGKKRHEPLFIRLLALYLCFLKYSNFIFAYSFFL